MMNSYIAFLQGHQWKPGLNELGDLTEISIPDIISAGIKELSEYVGNFLRENNVTETKTAIVSEDPFTDGMAKLYESLIRESPERIAIFQEFDDAESWLIDSGYK